MTEKGLREAKVLADKIRGQHIDAVYHSPLKRMVQTIKPILADLPDVYVEADKDLMGQGLGELEGGSYELLDFSSPRSADTHPGVECFDDFVSRLKQVTGRILGAQAPQVGQLDRVVAIATHGVGITSIFKVLESNTTCAGFNPPLAFRGPEAYEVRWTDSDDVAKLVVAKPAELPIKDCVVDWDRISGKPFEIVTWGKADSPRREMLNETSGRKI